MHAERLRAVADAIERTGGYEQTTYTFAAFHERLPPGSDDVEMRFVDGTAHTYTAFGEDSGEVLKDAAGNDCGTPACIGGWAAALSVDGRAPENVLMPIEGTWAAEAGQRWLGLTDQEAYQMFQSHPYTPDGEEMDEDQDQPTCAEALAMLRHAANTGEVVWPEREEVCA